MPDNNETRMSWWRDAKFGMFIHWGLYSLPAGEWKGQSIAGIGEWIMKRAKIPAAEYAQLAKQFNPMKFNAKEWVDVAKNAGMKYIVITAKHHDGFCMYHSKVSDYNIVDATPFDRDPMKELAEECHKAGLKLCFYYSQTQDWYEKDAVGNDWDFPVEEEKNFAKYLEEKVKPQVSELLTGYGPVGLIWFDTPMKISESQSRELAELVHQLQPNCIVNGRVGNGQGDYVCLGDNETPAQSLREDWETCATLNNTWAYKSNDHEWKSSDTIIKLLSDIVSKGGTYLLNVGPTAEGIIPQPSVDVLKQVGDWLKTNEEAIRCTTANPFDSEFDWGTLTLKPGKIYAHLFNWPDSGFAINGIKNQVKNAYLLADPNKSLQFDQRYEAELNHYTLSVSLPKSPNEVVPVLVLEIDGEIQVDNQLMQGADDSIILEAFRAEIHRASEGSPIVLSRSGVITRWSSAGDWLSWEFKAVTAGEFALRINSLAEKARDAIGEKIGRWEGGHQVTLEVAGQTVHSLVEENDRVVNSRSMYFHRIHSNCGTVRIDQPGNYTLTLKPVKLNYDMELGLKLVSVDLIKAK
ncbi:MAG: alpha-L-fucosidase [Bacilli bacterium]|nr:alpha-L-fucosidase [Bacilli bacterium]